MSQQKQHTLSKSVIFTGKGLHTGRIVRLEVLPAAPNTGIVFQRTDHPNAVAMAAHAANVTTSELCTTLGAGASSIGTIEHLMAAFVGMGVDNAVVQLNGPEVPILDGSSKPFVTGFMKAGLKRQNYNRRYMVVKEAFEFQDGDRFIRVEPAKKTEFHCEIDFGDSFIGRQSLSMRLNTKEFMKLSMARTFCHLNEVNAMRKVGLAQGGSLENAVVVTDSGILNEEGLRADDEFVRHKLLDCIGDLGLMGCPVVGKFTVVRPGHAFISNFMNALLAQRHKYLTVIEPGPAVREEDAEVALAAAVVYG